MSLYVLGDPHLSFGVDKPMDIFGGWGNYVERIERNWRDTVKEDDTIVLAGDISWAMKLNEALPDFRFIDALPGKKIILKGNHDYWWETKTARICGRTARPSTRTFRRIQGGQSRLSLFTICRESCPRFKVLQKARLDCQRSQERS